MLTSITHLRSPPSFVTCQWLDLISETLNKTKLDSSFIGRLTLRKLANVLGQARVTKPTPLCLSYEIASPSFKAPSFRSIKGDGILSDQLPMPALPFLFFEPSS